MTERCAICHQEPPALGPVRIARVHIHVAERADLSSAFEVFPARPLVQWIGVVCDRCVTVAHATAAAFEAQRRQLEIGAAPIPHVTARPARARRRRGPIGRLLAWLGVA